MKEKSVILTAVIGIILLELMALSRGINGQLLRCVLIILAGIAGWRVPTNVMKGGK